MKVQILSRTSLTISLIMNQTESKVYSCFTLQRIIKVKRTTKEPEVSPVNQKEEVKEEVQREQSPIPEEKAPILEEKPVDEVKPVFSFDGKSESNKFAPAIGGSSQPIIPATVGSIFG